MAYITILAREGVEANRPYQLIPVPCVEHLELLYSLQSHQSSLHRNTELRVTNGNRLCGLVLERKDEVAVEPREHIRAAEGDRRETVGDKKRSQGDEREIRGRSEAILRSSDDTLAWGRLKGYRTCNSARCAARGTSG